MLFHEKKYFICIYQWCSWDRNLRDRDLVKISRLDRDLKFETETSKFMQFAEIEKNVVITSDLNFLQISGIFPTCFGCFLPTYTPNKKSLNYINFNKPSLCNIQSLDTWNLRDRNSQKLVSRQVCSPRPSLETVTGIYAFLYCKMLVFWTKLFLFLPGKWIIANRCPRVFLPVRSAFSFNLLYDPPLRIMLDGVRHLCYIRIVRRSSKSSLSIICIINKCSLKDTLKHRQTFPF